MLQNYHVDISKHCLIYTFVILNGRQPLQDIIKVKHIVLLFRLLIIIL